MREFLTTTGRFPRSVYWFFFIVLYCLLFVVGFAAERFNPSEGTQAFLGFLMLPVFGISLIVQIKRWHDLDRSGWWVLINLIPCVGFLWSFVVLGFFKGTTGPNRFGPDPLQT